MDIHIIPNKVQSVIKDRLNKSLNTNINANDLIDKPKLLDNYNIGKDVPNIISIVCDKVANEILDVAIENMSSFVDDSIRSLGCEILYKLDNFDDKNDHVNNIQRISNISTYPLINDLVIMDEYNKYVINKEESNTEKFIVRLQEYEEHKNKVKARNILIGVVTEQNDFTEEEMLARNMEVDVQNIFLEKKEKGSCSRLITLKENLCYLISSLLLMLILKLVDISFCLMEYKEIKTIQDSTVIKAIKLLYYSTQKNKDKESFDKLLVDIKNRLGACN